MSIFCYKKIVTAERLGERLRKRREELGLSLEEIAATTHIQPKYVSALESNNYSQLPPAKAHRTAYIREYALALSVDPENCLAQFLKEEGLEDTDSRHPLTALRFARFASISSLIKAGTLACLVFLFAGYLIWQIHGVLQPPLLAVYAPIEGDVVNQTSITVQGETNRENNLTINGQDIMVNDKGEFETKVDLSEGVNTITVTATKKHGKTSTLVRHIVLEPKATTGLISLKP